MRRLGLPTLPSLEVGRQLRGPNGLLLEDGRSSGLKFREKARENAYRIAAPVRHGGLDLVKSSANAIALLLATLTLLGGAAGQVRDFSIMTDTYSNVATLEATEFFHTYKLTASAGQRVAYTIQTMTPGGCTVLLFLRGHVVNLQSQYYVDYSQESCATSYSNEFPVSSQDGTAFAILVTTDRAGAVAYGLDVNIRAPNLAEVLQDAAGPIILGTLIILAVIGVARFAIRRARRRRQEGEGMPGLPPWPPEEPPSGGEPPREPKWP